MGGEVRDELLGYISFIKGKYEEVHLYKKSTRMVIVMVIKRGLATMSVIQAYLDVDQDGHDIFSMCVPIQKDTDLSRLFLISFS